MLPSRDQCRPIDRGVLFGRPPIHPSAPPSLCHPNITYIMNGTCFTDPKMKYLHKKGLRSRFIGRDGSGAFGDTGESIS